MPILRAIQLEIDGSGRVPRRNAILRQRGGFPKLVYDLLAIPSTAQETNS